MLATYVSCLVLRPKKILKAVKRRVNIERGAKNRVSPERCPIKKGEKK
jgi:hypothetical protein